MICLFSSLRLFLGSPSRRLWGSPNHPESGQDPEEGSEGVGEEGTLGSEKGLSIHWPNIAASLTSRAFVEWPLSLGFPCPL